MTLTALRQAFLWLVEILIALFLAFLLVYSFGMQVKVSGSSMESTINDGESVLVDRIGYAFFSPTAGDVVVFFPNGNEKSGYAIKRIVAVPGDTVQILDGVLYVNGALYDEEDTEAIAYAGLAQEELTLADGEYFVLGDNRNNSEDSRYAHIGTVSTDDIVGRAWLSFSSIGDMKRIQ